MALEGDQFKQLMDAIEASKTGIEQQFTARLDQLQREVAMTQATSSQQVLDKLSRKAYTFKKKGCEEQFLFNDKVDERLDAAKSHLEKVTPKDEASKLALQQATSELEQGKEAIRVRQKHIRIADRDDWGAVAEYEADELADDSDDEKRLFKAKKERDAKKKASSFGRYSQKEAED